MTFAPHYAAISNASTALWWGVPVVAGSFLLIGGLLTFSFNFALERSRARRESRQRWDTILLEDGTHLLSEAHRVANGYDESLWEGLEDDPWGDMTALWRFRAKHPELLSRLIVLGENHLGDDGQVVLACAIRQQKSRRAEPGDGDSDQFVTAQQNFVRNLHTQLGVEKEKLTLLDRILEPARQRRREREMEARSKDFSLDAGTNSPDPTP